MPRAVILSAVRTPIGRYGGALAGVRPDDLAALAVVDAAKLPITTRPGAAAVETWTLPLTAPAAADVVITEHAVFRLREGRLVLTELLGGATVDDTVAETAASVTVDLDRTAASDR